MSTLYDTIDRINRIFYGHNEGASSTSVCRKEDERSSEDDAHVSARRGSDAPSLTTYKEVVYNFEKYQEQYRKNQDELTKFQYKQRFWSNLDTNQIVYYGLTKDQLQQVENKLELQSRFLDMSFLSDKFSGNLIPLKDLVISANHSPHRYYAEIQNRVNTLVGEALRKELVPVFMTITLPSRYHPFRLVGKKLVKNPNYDGTPPREAVKALTKRFARLRNDRSIREIPKAQRVFFRVNEPHQSGTPHTHILYFIPSERVERVIQAFKRLFPEKGNDIQHEIKDAVGYVMKYINKTLPKSKGRKLSRKNRYLNAWYSHHRIVRFSSSRTLAPLYLYRLLYQRYSLRALTRLINERRIRILRPVDDLGKIAEIFEGEDLIYMRNENFTLEKHRG